MFFTWQSLVEKVQPKNINKMTATSLLETNNPNLGSLLASSKLPLSRSDRQFSPSAWGKPSGRRGWLYQIPELNEASNGKIIYKWWMFNCLDSQMVYIYIHITVIRVWLRLVWNPSCATFMGVFEILNHRIFWRENVGKRGTEHLLNGQHPVVSTSKKTHDNNQQNRSWENINNQKLDYTKSYL